MQFWWFMFFCNMLYSVLMIIGGYYMWKRTPKFGNSLSGYRSRRSSVNENTWRFANKNCGRRWWIIGWIMFAPTVLVQLPFYGSDKDTVGNVGLIICIIECTVMILSIIPTETALKKEFNDDGTRKINNI